MYLAKYLYLKINKGEIYMKEKTNKIYQKYEEFIKYTLAGTVTVAASLVTYYICVLTFLNPKNAIQLQIANILSWVAGLIFSYYSNSRFVFKTNQSKLKQVYKFAVSRIFTLLLDMAIMFFGVTAFKFNDKILKIISQILVIIINYISSKLFVFKKHHKD